MSPFIAYLHDQACNNLWANHRLLRACAELSDADFAVTRTSFFPSIKATLNHNLTVDWYYVDALERSAKGLPANEAALAFFDPLEPYDHCAQLRTEQLEVDRRLIALCANLTDSDLLSLVPVQRAKRVDHEPKARLLAHLFQHQVHHRGQVHAMLAGTKVKPPQLDEFFCVSDAKRRAAELSELGIHDRAASV